MLKLIKPFKINISTGQLQDFKQDINYTRPIAQTGQSDTQINISGANLKTYYA